MIDTTRMKTNSNADLKAQKISEIASGEAMASTLFFQMTGMKAEVESDLADDELREISWEEELQE